LAKKSHTYINLGNPNIVYINLGNPNIGSCKTNAMIIKLLDHIVKEQLIDNTAITSLHDIMVVID